MQRYLIWFASRFYCPKIPLTRLLFLPKVLFRNNFALSRDIAGLFTVPNLLLQSSVLLRSI
jgi:hypothetical protein